VFPSESVLGGPQFVGSGGYGTCAYPIDAAVIIVMKYKMKIKKKVINIPLKDNGERMAAAMVNLKIQQVLLF
jgi:hypothetical protein